MTTTTQPPANSPPNKNSESHINRQQRNNLPYLCPTKREALVGQPRLSRYSSCRRRSYPRRRLSTTQWIARTGKAGSIKTINFWRRTQTRSSRSEQGNWSQQELSFNSSHRPTKPWLLSKQTCKHSCRQLRSNMPTFRKGWASSTGCKWSSQPLQIQTP